MHTNIQVFPVLKQEYKFNRGMKTVPQYQGLIKTVKTTFYTSKHVNNINTVEVTKKQGAVFFIVNVCYF